MDIKTFLKITKASAGAMTADVAVLALKTVFGDALGGVLGTGLREFLKKYQDMPEDELKKTPVPEDIAEEIKKQVELYMKEQKHPVYMSGAVFFFERDIDEEEEEELRGYIEYEFEYEDEEDEETKYQRIVSRFIEDYSAPDNIDCGIYKDILYINFEDAKTDGDLLCNEDRVREAAHALNYLRSQEGGLVNRIVSYAIFY